MAEVEEWRVIEDYPAYEVSSFGQVRKGNLSISKSKSNGKHLVKLQRHGRQTTAYVHRLVAKAFLDAPKCGETVVRHKDENQFNNHYTNLKWIKAGKKNVNGKKYSDEEIIAIRKDILAGFGRKEIAKKYNLKITIADKILAGQVGKSCEYLKGEVAEYLKESKLKSRYKIKNGTFIEWLFAFRQDILNGLSLPKLAKKYKISEGQASNIRLGECQQEYPQLRDEVELYVLQSRQDRLHRQQRDSLIRDEQEAICERIAEIKNTLKTPARPTQTMFDGKPLEIMEYKTSSGAIVSLPRVKFLENRI